MYSKNFKSFIATLAGLLIIQAELSAQDANLESWQINTDGTTASYWQAQGPMHNPTFVFNTSSDSADVLEVCYNSTDVYIRSEGMTVNMGQFTNPGAPSAQGYVWKLPLQPAQASTKQLTPTVGALGVLTNGIPIYGKGDATSYSQGSGTNERDGDGVWNQDAYYSEGETLDTAFAAHPQQEGAYHTHATPFRLYKNEVGHSPIVGWSSDGFPIYGPMGYDDPLDTNSSIVRITSGYELRSISKRETLADGTVLAVNQQGPDVSSSFPLGMYNEDYEWVDQLGHLDEYNGRFAKTPEYPEGTYAYFVTTDAAGAPAYPYYVGTYYYGTPVTANQVQRMNVDWPSSGLSCVGDATVKLVSSQLQSQIAFQYQNHQLTIQHTAAPIQEVQVYHSSGRLKQSFQVYDTQFQVNTRSWSSGKYFFAITTQGQTLTRAILVQPQ